MCLTNWVTSNPEPGQQVQLVHCIIASIYHSESHEM